MAITLKPIGDYYYDTDSCSFDEAWEQLEEAYRSKCFVVCRAVAFSETESSLELEYHNIRGRINRGYITQNRNLASDFFVGKTFCVQITKLRRNSRSFMASRLPVEIEAKAQLRKLNAGDFLEGNLIKIGFNDDFCFVDVMEGITFFLGESGITWKPKGCQKISDRFSLGDRVSGVAIYVEPIGSERETAGRMSCVKLRDEWLPETARLIVGTIVEGIAHQNCRHLGMYYISLSPLVYIEFESKQIIPSDIPVQVRITERNEKAFRIAGELVGFVSLPDPIPAPDPAPDPAPNLDPIPDSDTPTNPLNDPEQYTAPIKTTVSPFAIRKGELKEFESVPNQIAPHKRLQEGVRSGQINDFHFHVLQAVNAFVFSTSKMIAGYMSAMGTWPKGLSRSKLNRKLESMAKLGILDRIRFNSDEGKSIYMVYFLGKNGESLLRVHCGIRKTSYDPVMLATPVVDVKRYLATNQIIVAYMQYFPFFKNFAIRKVYEAAEDTPVRVPGRLNLENSNLLLETQRRSPGWQEDLLEKANRYWVLMKKHQEGVLPTKSQFLQEKNLYLLLVCEDDIHAGEIRDLLYGHSLYPNVFFTYDLLIFQRNINQSIFKFSANGSSVYYDVTELLHYNISKSVGEGQQEELADNTLEGLLHCLKKSPSMTLEYLRSHDDFHIREYVQQELTDLYQIDDEGNYIPIYPEEAQYYAWLLHVITRNLLQAPSAAFFGVSISDLAKKQPQLQAQAVRIEPKILEQAVQMVVSRLEDYVSSTVNGVITKHSTMQTSGTQFGYDVGMDFQVAGKNYRLGFECKSYQTLREKNEAGGDVRLRVGEYGKNLLQYYMYCNKNSSERNYWILISPYADLQNDFQKNLVDRWNGDIPFMKLKAITRHQSEINCETFFALNPEAFQMVYQRNCPELTEDEKETLAEKIYNYIVGERSVSCDVAIALDDYPFPAMEIIPLDQRLTLETAEGEDIQQAILQSLSNEQHVFLVGEYGSGKTYMTHHLVETILANSEEYAYCPLWFRLVERKVCHEQEEIQNMAKAFVEDGINKHSQKIRNQIRLGTKRTLVILDGMDEMFSGLGSSIMKIELLNQIMKAAKRIMGNKVLFLISSREFDFNSCINGQNAIQELGRFKKIQIGSCRMEDAVHKLRAVEREQAGGTEGVSSSLTSKSGLMQISRKPLYYGFLREIIRERGDNDELESEIDLLHEIVIRSIDHYLAELEREGTGIQRSDVLQWLCDVAIRISCQRTRGEKEVYLTNKRMTFKGYLKNVVRIINIRGNEYHVIFYHNTIREYLVAYSISQEAKKRLSQSYALDDMPSTTLQDLALTPEMIEFFCAMIHDKRDAVRQNLKELLQKAREPKYSLMGANLISILCRLDPNYPGLRDMDLQGIYADDLHLYRCKLENLNLQDSRMCNLHLFDVDLKNVDLRGSDLKGLVLGQYGGVADAQHRKQGNRLSIFGLYENQHLVEYRFKDIHERRCEIISHAPQQAG